MILKSSAVVTLSLSYSTFTGKFTYLQTKAFPRYLSIPPIRIQANLTFTLLLTLKMTAAKAVETSVTSTKSLSQDYSNLDDFYCLSTYRQFV